MQRTQADEVFNDGLVYIYNVRNAAENGRKPVEELGLKYSLRYHERTVGLNRFFTALQANVKVDMLLRCPRVREISTQDVAIPNDGKQYSIEQIQYPEDIKPPVMDLSLSIIEQEYEIGGQDDQGD